MKRQIEKDRQTERDSKTERDQETEKGRYTEEEGYTYVQKDKQRQRVIKTKDGWVIVFLTKNLMSQGQRTLKTEREKQINKYGTIKKQD